MHSTDRTYDVRLIRWSLYFLLASIGMRITLFRDIHTSLVAQAPLMCLYSFFIFYLIIRLIWHVIGAYSPVTGRQYSIDAASYRAPRTVGDVKPHQIPQLLIVLTLLGGVMFGGAISYVESTQLDVPLQPLRLISNLFTGVMYVSSGNLLRVSVDFLIRRLRNTKMLGSD